MAAETSHDAGRPAKRATIVDVAQHAGVSTASASKVLRGVQGVSPGMRARVEASMQALSYRPHRLARGMRGSTFTVGVMLSDIDNPFFGVLVRGLSEVFATQKYELLIAPATSGETSQEAVIDSLIDHQMDGLVLIAPRSHEEHLEEIGRQIPTVVIGPHGPSQHYDTVSDDDQLGAELVVDYLVALGHRHIAFLANRHPSNLVNLPEVARGRGYEEAMTRRSLTQEVTFIEGDWSHEGGRAVGRHLLESYPRPTAIFAGADVAALGVLATCWEDGVRIPDELSVVGYDNSPTGALTPISLTSVDQAGHEMGATAGQLLLERIHGRSEARNEVLTPRLVVRRTTGPI
ncbi:LacI family DNA-binding transcriptional regulator [Kribbella speibonae]|uniref:LacI family transcriptional regulator n=1 Tax=Kribbella speibonae TaxID=1572660 RepID=A0A4R0J585_9ACTN|nr:LacI family DNA-binding transcriptional regulator [Kribbella speibonae]TCC36475.1 LacI family transcriptional regulator [Kribbella speibonae]